MNKITLAPTSLPESGPLEMIDAAAQAGFDGLGLRMHKSPAFPNWRSWLGDEAVKRDVKSALASSGQHLVETLSYYMEPEMDFDEMKPSLEFAAELGATYALVIGRDPEWPRISDNFGRFCDVCAGLGLTAAIEAPVGSLSPIAEALKLVKEAGKGVLCIDPLAFHRAGNHAGDVKWEDAKLFPYTQLTDGRDGERSRSRPGDGDAQVAALLDALPANLPLSLEWGAPSDSSVSPVEWAKAAMAGTRRFLDDYYAAKSGAWVR